MIKAICSSIGIACFTP
ncbi:hypothetical protein M0N37_19600 [Aeromonas taiwanensis]|nr:hypothetical protein [Aeromonas taiwanensis]